MMCSCVFKFSLFFPFIILVEGSIDINLAEFQYIADHLTEKECHELVAALHFHSFELPKEINGAERRLPEGIPCIDLLLHWNSTPREGKGETHAEVCHRLNQIGREDLAQWLSRTVFHEISKDLNAELLEIEIEDSTLSPPKITEHNFTEEIKDEAAWWTMDSLLEILIVFGLICLVLGSIFLCFLCIKRSDKSQKGYRKLPAQYY